jgi:hypothetical protein
MAVVAAYSLATVIAECPLSRVEASSSGDRLGSGTALPPNYRLGWSGAAGLPAREAEVPPMAWVGPTAFARDTVKRSLTLPGRFGS